MIKDDNIILKGHHYQSDGLYGIPLHNQTPLSTKIRLPATNIVLYKEHQIKSLSASTTSSLITTSTRPKSRYVNIFEEPDPLLRLNNYDNTIKEGQKYDRISPQQHKLRVILRK